MQIFYVVSWIDLFIRNVYKEMLINSIKYCQTHKVLELYEYCILTSHVYLTIGSKKNGMSSIMCDLKPHTSEELKKLYNAIQKKAEKNGCKN